MDVITLTLKNKCWVCEGDNLFLIKKGTNKSNISADDFQITDTNYGDTFDIYRCNKCNFLQCPNTDDVLKYYINMEDKGYEETRKERSIQAHKLIKYIKKNKHEGRLLDIGAGSGILVEEAIKTGFQAEGIEPSRFLQEQASTLKLPVINGVLPHKEINGPYDVITLIDVIEHVCEPVKIIQQASTLLATDGLLIVVTPNVKSVFARLLGWKWWHFRMAHIGYFSKDTLHKTLGRADLVPLQWESPTWHFPMSYIYIRILQYLPKFMRHRAPSFMDRIIVPLNLFDSFLVICKKTK